MAKKHNRNLIGFRTPSEKEKDRIKKEAEELDVSLYDLVNLGLELKKASNNERTIFSIQAPYYLWGSWTTASCFMVNNWIFQNIVDHHYDSNWRRNRILFETDRNSGSIF